jgi:tRNA A-37 threonylcarbamoyl transferase component Bud32
VCRVELFVTTGEDLPRTFGGRYVLAEQLTSGAAREVWRAHDDVVGRQVALKVFFGPTVIDPLWRKAFRHDAKRLAALSHPGIAKTYEYAETDLEAWLAISFVSGAPLADRIGSGSPISPAEGLELIGQTALALQAAHDVGVVHGALSPASLMVRDVGVVSLIGFAITPGATKAEDLRALGGLAHDCLKSTLTSTPERRVEIDAFVGWLTNPDHAKPPADAADVGRTALALAASLGGGHVTAMVPEATPDSALNDAIDAAPRYDVAERKRVRNRLIALGAIVVVFGGALMFLIGRGGGEVSVPYVVGLPLSQAQIELTSAGLRDTQAVALTGNDSGGTVIAESPAAGVRVKAGSVIRLTISAGNP